METTEPKTYAETRNRKVTNWPKVIRKLIREVPVWYDSSFYKRLEELKKLAGDWPTCACGNQCEVIVRNLCGEPNDGRLFQLGMDFYRRIADAYYASDDSSAFSRKEIRSELMRALEVFEKIEERSFELIVAYHDKKSR